MTVEMEANATAPREKAAIVPLEFYTEYKPDPLKPGEMKGVEWVRWAKKGTTLSETCERVKDAREAKIVWAELAPHYEAWKRGQDMPLVGTPLAAWPGVTRQQADILKFLNVRTVEDVAAMTDADRMRFGLGGLELIQQAKAFLEAQRDRSVIAAEMAGRDKKLAEQSTEIADLKAMLQQQGAMLQQFMAQQSAASAAPAAPPAALLLMPGMM